MASAATLPFHSEGSASTGTNPSQFYLLHFRNSSRILRESPPHPGDEACSIGFASCPAGGIGPEPGAPPRRIRPRAPTHNG